MITASATDNYSLARAFNNANGNLLTLNRNAGSAASMDSLTYHYKAGTNQLLYVDDAIDEVNFTQDIDDQDTNNYAYDKIGNLIFDRAEEIAEITWTVYGKIKSIVRDSTSSKPNLSFEYTPDGHRVAKHVTDTSGETTSTWYIRDASGNIMSTYSRTWIEAPSNTDIEYLDIYDQLVLDKSYVSRLDFLNEEIEWHDDLSSVFIDSLKADVALFYLYEVLGHFACAPMLSSAQIDSLYGTMTDSLVVLMLRDNGQLDGATYDVQVILRTC